MNYKIKQAYIKMLEQDLKKYVVVLQNNKYIVQTVDDAIIFTDINKARQMVDAKNKELQIKQQSIPQTQKTVQSEQPIKEEGEVSVSDGMSASDVNTFKLDVTDLTAGGSVFKKPIKRRKIKFLTSKVKK